MVFIFRFSNCFLDVEWHEMKLVMRWNFFPDENDMRWRYNGPRRRNSPKLAIYYSKMLLFNTVWIEDTFISWIH